jgi:hypothetical protein
MRFPNFLDDKFTDANGYLSDTWRHILMQMFQTLQGNLSTEGIKVPQQTDTNVGLIGTDKAIGAIIYNNDPTKNYLMVNLPNLLSPTGWKFQHLLTAASLGATYPLAYDPSTETLSFVAGISSQYLRGDLTWQTLDTLAVPENTNLYYTDARARGSISSSLSGLTYTSSTGVFSLATGYYFPTTTDQTNWNGMIPLTQKGAANGVATLDAGGLVPTSQIPAIYINNVYVVASQAAMLALSAVIGDVAVRTDTNQTFMLHALPPSTLANWVELLFPLPPVTSVNGLTGNVSLGALSPLSYNAVNTRYEIQQANTSQSGYLSNTDWNTFNSKQPSSANLTSLSGLTYVSTSFVKMTSAGTFGLDTNTYLTSLSGAVLTDQTTPQTIGNTTNRLAKLWATDITVTNAISGSVTGSSGSCTGNAASATQVYITQKSDAVAYYVPFLAATTAGNAGLNVSIYSPYVVAGGASAGNFVVPGIIFGVALNILGTTEATTGGAGSIITSGGIYATKAIINGSTTDSSSTTTGAIVTAGGVAIGKKLYVGTGIYLPTAGGTTSQLDYYEEYTLTTNFTGPCTLSNVEIKCVRNGKTVTISAKPATGTSTTATYFSSSSALKSTFRPINASCSTVQNRVSDNGVTKIGWFEIHTDGILYIGVAPADLFSNTGTVGWYYYQIATYIIDF